MGLADIIRGGVAIINNTIKDIQTPVTIQAWIAQDQNGKPSYASPYTVPAFIEVGSRSLKLDDGTMTVASAYILILTPLTANGAAGRREALDARDLITLPDGIARGILKIAGLNSGVMDTKTQLPYFYEVWFQ